MSIDSRLTSLEEAAHINGMACLCRPPALSYVDETDEGAPAPPRRVETIICEACGRLRAVKTFVLVNRPEVQR